MKYKEKILITGSAGFIGYHLVSSFLNENYIIFGLDNLNEYYDVNLKYARLLEHGIKEECIFEKTIVKSNKHPNYHFVKANLEDFDFVVEFICDNKFDYIINLAAQAGVRYSLENPKIYVKSNIEGFLSVLEGARQSNVKHLIYASTSSVYGLNTSMPLREDQSTEHPMTLYAATKKSNEMMAHSYSHLFRIPTTGLRFFTVYGPWGRPDMALFLFTKAILEGNAINVFNNGNMIRDFTYVGDIVESIKRIVFKPADPYENFNGKKPLSSKSSAPYSIYNIGNASPVLITDYIQALEKTIGISAIYNYMPMQIGDVPATHADINALQDFIRFRPKTSVEIGIRLFFDWYKNYYKIK